MLKRSTWTKKEKRSASFLVREWLAFLKYFGAHSSTARNTKRKEFGVFPGVHVLENVPQGHKKEITQ